MNEATRNLSLSEELLQLVPRGKRKHARKILRKIEKSGSKAIERYKFAQQTFTNDPGM